MVVRPANQGSSIGVAIINEESGLEWDFKNSIDAAFFRKTILHATDWIKKHISKKLVIIHQLADIREGIGFPLGT